MTIRSQPVIGARAFRRCRIRSRALVRATRAMAVSRRHSGGFIQPLESGKPDRILGFQEAKFESGEFSSRVGHDLRAPLRHMEGFAALLARHLGSRPGALDDKGRHYLARITGASKAMGSILEDLLAYSRVARRAAVFTTVDLDRMVASLRDGLPSASIWDVGPLGKVLGDPPQLGQVLHNLLANAVKFSVPRQDPRVWVRKAGMRGGRVIFEVGDNGVGFDPAFTDQLFGVFQRLHPKGEFEGSGIGLAIVARVVHNHGGEVWAESGPGDGARFFFTLQALEDDS